jgi:hypothetical protein
MSLGPPQQLELFNKLANLLVGEDLLPDQFTADFANLLQHHQLPINTTAAVWIFEAVMILLISISWRPAELSGCVDTTAAWTHWVAVIVVSIVRTSCIRVFGEGDSL